jgi:hypothetical protein
VVTHKPGGLRPSSTPLDTPRRTPVMVDLLPRNSVKAIEALREQLRLASESSSSTLDELDGASLTSETSSFKDRMKLRKHRFIETT